jgi:hypothetical protein
VSAAPPRRYAPSRFHRIYPPRRSTPATGSGEGWAIASSGASTRSGTSSGWRVKAGSTTRSYGIPRRIRAARCAPPAPTGGRTR